MGINDKMTYIKEKGRFNEVFNELVKLGNGFPASGILKAL